MRRRCRGTPGLLAFVQATPPGPQQRGATGKVSTGLPCGSVLRCASPLDEVLGIVASASLVHLKTDVAPPARRDNELLKEVSGLLIQGFRCTAMGTSLHIRSGVRAHAWPVLILAEGQESLLLASISCCHMVMACVQNVCEEVRELWNKYTPHRPAGAWGLVCLVWELARSIIAQRNAPSRSFASLRASVSPASGRANMRLSPCTGSVRVFELVIAF